MRPLMELSAALDTAMPNANSLFRMSFSATPPLDSGKSLNDPEKKNSLSNNYVLFICIYL